MPARRHRSGTLAALITAVAAAVPEALGAVARTPRAAPGAASPEANLGRRRLCAASIALLPIIACACAGNSAAASPVASSQLTLPQPPTSRPSKLRQRPRYRRPPQFVMISFDGSGDPALWKHWRAVGRPTGARLTFFVSGVQLPDNEIQGGRTPCLQGRLDQLRWALRSDGMSYDASATGLPGTWPQRVHGIWSFPLALIKLVGTPWDSLSMDYNFYVNRSNATEVSPARARVLEQDAYLSYLRYFGANY